MIWAQPFRTEQCFRAVTNCSSNGGCVHDCSDASVFHHEVRALASSYKEAIEFGASRHQIGRSGRYQTYALLEIVHRIAKYRFGGHSSNSFRTTVLTAVTDHHEVVLQAHQM